MRGLAKNTGFESLKVTLRAACGERWHLDTLDLCVARQRDNFVDRGGGGNDSETRAVEARPGQGAAASSRNCRRRGLKAEAAPKKAAPDLPAALLERGARRSCAIRACGTASAEHAAACGIAGERINVLVGYLGAVSRLLDRPLAIIIQSSTAAGKTTLMDAIARVRAAGARGSNTRR